MVRSIIEANDLLGCAYSEVFAGGAGLAIKLLLKGDVSSITINDYDWAVYCMWDAIVNKSDDMCAFIDSAVLTPDEWQRHREVYRDRDAADALALAESTLYLNRTNVSGILGGGLIGGMEQNGTYKMDARFNRETLKRKIRRIAGQNNRITVTHLDAEQFVDKRLQSPNEFAYLDPPYVQKGPGLYESSFDEKKHRSLAKKISACPCKWLVTYDADELVEELYAGFSQNELDINYTANTRIRTIGKEKVILGLGLEWPQTSVGRKRK
jgi:DNA adenine methylase